MQLLQLILKLLSEIKMLRKEIARDGVAIPEVIHGIANLVFDRKALPVMMISVGIIGSTTPKRINAFHLAIISQTTTARSSGDIRLAQ
ncbi:hypothetical protein HNY73_007314 [Argiope bruennichi]|uniref:Uncharacterized protein n=1 Tax=Argiope bruennichi TaxID=94029 RepID=A0A8T0FDK5_ARGBR|nr:hypothetical protein HNY73_007314 [Argiope bruennichi]